MPSGTQLDTETDPGGPSRETETNPGEHPRSPGPFWEPFLGRSRVLRDPVSRTLRETSPDPTGSQPGGQRDPNPGVNGIRFPYPPGSMDLCRVSHSLPDPTGSRLPDPTGDDPGPNGIPTRGSTGSQPRGQRDPVPVPSGIRFWGPLFGPFSRGLGWVGELTQCSETRCPGGFFAVRTL